MSRPRVQGRQPLPGSSYDPERAAHRRAAAWGWSQDIKHSTPTPQSSVELIDWRFRLFVASGEAWPVDALAEDGDCFKVAFSLVVENPTWRLCHGVVTRDYDGRRHVHAWVERPVVAMVPMWDGPYYGNEVTPPDMPASMVRVETWEAVDRANGNDLVMPREAYRNAGKAEHVVVYTAEVALRAAVSRGHWGPWDARLELGAF